MTIQGVRTRPVIVPLARPLVTAGGTVAAVPLVLTDLETSEGVTGLSYVFCYTPIALKATALMVEGAAELVRGDPVAPFLIDEKLEKHFRLFGVQGVTRLALAAIDIAVWDALAKIRGVPLVRLLGGEPRAVRAYNSCGLGIIGPERAAAEAVDLLEPDFKALKIRLGYQDAANDVEVVRAVRAAVGASVTLMTDYNQSLSVAEAQRRVRLLDDEQLHWIEEPVRAPDFSGHALVARDASTPIQLGENWWSTLEMSRSIAAAASDLVMPDVGKIGGVTGWLRAAGLAEAPGLPLSSHLYPEISAHLLAVTPTCDWLEFVDWAAPILAEPCGVRDSAVTATEAPGIGMAWNEKAVERFLAH